MEDKRWRMAQVARMYFVENLTQQAIAREMHVSRSTVSRLLMEARRENVVSIHINYPWQVDSRLSTRLRKAYSLSTALVLVTEGLSPEEQKQGLGILGFHILKHVLTPGCCVAVAPGSSVAALVDALPPRPDLGCRVADLTGVPPFETPNTAGRLASLLGGVHFPITEPLLAAGPGALEDSLHHPGVREAMEQAAEAQVALAGIGLAESWLDALCQAGAITPEEARRALQAGAVAETAGILLTARGEVLSGPLSARLLRLTPEKLREIQLVIATAAGASKVRAIQAALRSGLINILVTDDLTAQGLLKK